MVMEWLYYIIFFIVGTVFGSFYGVVGMRLANNESLLHPASHCTFCKHPLKALDLVPIFSYLFLKGRCRYCKEKLSITYLFVELVTGVLFTLSYYAFGFTPSMVLALILCSLFAIVLVSDLHFFIIPDEVLITSSILIIITQLFRIGIGETMFHILTGVCLFGFMYLMMLLGNRLFHKESLGGGDIKLMFLVGLVLDPVLGVFSIFLASIIALPISCILLKKNDEHMIPFGPFILIAVLLLYFAKLDPSSFLSILTI